MCLAKYTKFFQQQASIDSLGRPTVPAGRDHYFRPRFRLYVRPHYQNIAKQNKRLLKIIITSTGTVGLAVGIIDYICLVLFCCNIEEFKTWINSISFLKGVKFLPDTDTKISIEKKVQSKMEIM